MYLVNKDYYRKSATAEWQLYFSNSYGSNSRFLVIVFDRRRSTVISAVDVVVKRFRRCFSPQIGRERRRRHVALSLDTKRRLFSFYRNRLRCCCCCCGHVTSWILISRAGFRPLSMSLSHPPYLRACPSDSPPVHGHCWQYKLPSLFGAIVAGAGSAVQSRRSAVPCNWRQLRRRQAHRCVVRVSKPSPST